MYDYVIIYSYKYNHIHTIIYIQAYTNNHIHTIIYIYTLKLWLHGANLRVYWGPFVWKCCLACEFLAGKSAFSLHKSSNKDFLNWDHHPRQDGKSTITAFEITRDCNDAGGDGNHDLEDAPKPQEPWHPTNLDAKSIPKGKADVKSPVFAATKWKCLRNIGSKGPGHGMVLWRTVFALWNLKL